MVTEPKRSSVRALLRRTAMVCVFLLGAYGLFVAINSLLPGRAIVDPLDHRGVVDRSHLLVLSSAFSDHFRSGRGGLVRGLEHSIVWAELKRLMDRAPEGDHHGIVFHFGAEASELVLALSPVVFVEMAPDSFRYHDDGSPFLQLCHGRLEPAVKETWTERYQRPWFSRTGYFQEMELRRHQDDDFERVHWGRDPHASTFAWEDDVLVMYRETLRDLDIGDSTLYLVVRSISGPADPVAQRDFQHRLCLFLRLEHLGGARDLVDDVRYRAEDGDTSTSSFRMKATDFGDPCPPACTLYVRPRALHQYLSRDLPSTSSSSAPY